MSNLIECIDCGKQVSKRATTCPNCGAPVKLTIAEIEKPKKSYMQIEQEKLEAKLGVKKKSEEIRKVDKKDPNRSLIIILIIVIITIALIAFGIFFFTETGQKMFNADYKSCVRVYGESMCAILLQ